jgi:hypothetical protein
MMGINSRIKVVRFIDPSNPKHIVAGIVLQHVRQEIGIGLAGGRGRIVGSSTKLEHRMTVPGVNYGQVRRAHFVANEKKLGEIGERILR